MQSNENFAERKARADQETSGIMEYANLWAVQQKIRRNLEALTFDTDEILDLYPHHKAPVCYVTKRKLDDQLGLLRQRVDDLLMTIERAAVFHNKFEERENKHEIRLAFKAYPSRAFL
ncbi:hypothetical protein [Microscilla marina]|uniref:Uncharacterized protein n=1 Tax=Microscilla marina ATCC 23134 TaxID=313606 RepID=A1ZMY7_MICM2|nr:hypothetical protein [Microscilla marina]EAY28168.1 hypothetical protein M23134_03429 [Microscilla marina ATCC 23134]